MGSFPSPSPPSFTSQRHRRVLASPSPTHRATTQEHPLPGFTQAPIHLTTNANANADNTFPFGCVYLATAARYLSSTTPTLIPIQYDRSDDVDNPTSEQVRPAYSARFHLYPSMVTTPFPVSEMVSSGAKWMGCTVGGLPYRGDCAPGWTTCTQAYIRRQHRVFKLTLIRSIPPTSSCGLLRAPLVTLISHHVKEVEASAAKQLLSIALPIHSVKERTSIQPNFSFCNSSLTWINARALALSVSCVR